jgi:uncharacterized membrane protein YhaH (DUF805 family)
MHSVALLLQDVPNQQALQHMIILLAAIIPFLILIGIAAVMVPCWFILKKAGFTPWLALLCLIPSVGTLVLLYVLAFSEWKVPALPPNAWQPQPPYPPYPPQG